VKASRPPASFLRWPAEWEPHAATWLAWPHNAETWPGRLAAVERAFVAMVAALRAGERVEILVRNARHGRSVAEQLGPQAADPGVRLHEIATDDAWIRDHGPVFVLDAERGETVLLDFGFDAWGGKYPPWDRDAAVPAALAERRGGRRLVPGFVLEGGSVDGDGEGTVLTTEQCLLHPNRGPLSAGPRDRAGAEAELRRWLGAERVVWLGRGITGDDTDGHVDDVARFVAPGRVAATVPDGAGHPDAEALRDNRERLRRTTDARGRRLEVVDLPAPPLVRCRGGQPLPASYANFYVANAAVLVPVFDAPSDERALAVLRDALERPVAPIPARDLVVGLGAVHCLTQQEPRAPGPP